MIHIPKTAMCAVVALLCTSGAQAVLTADDFVAIRLIEGAYDGLPYETGGISNAGDIFGASWWPDDAEHREHFEQAVRWLRSNSYAPEIVNGGQEHVVHPCCGGAPGTTATPGEAYYGIHSGSNCNVPGCSHRSVTPDGTAVGRIHVDVPAGGANFVSFLYDIKNDVLTVLPPGVATDVNSQGLITETWSDGGGSHGNGYYSRLSSLDAADADPAYELVPWRPTFTFNDRFPFAISNQNIIVGSVGSIFVRDALMPMKQVPTGENTWSDPMPLESLDNVGSVIDISDDSDRPFGVGISGSPQSHAVVWDINAETIVADFGPLTEAFQISTDGTMVAGIRKEFFPPGDTPTVWSTDDDWQTFTDLDLHEALDEQLGLEGADIWVELTAMDGINDAGQVVGIGTYIADDAEVEGVFLLDTLALAAVLLGDVNNDGDVNNLDITPFIAALSAANEAAFLTQFPNGNYAVADIDMSGSANNLDITPFIGLLTAAGSNAMAVPEPSSLACVVLALTIGRRRAVRR